jgi:hypothetical protein
MYKGLTCEVEFTQEGQTLRQRTGSGVLRIDAARVAEASK